MKKQVMLTMLSASALALMLSSTPRTAPAQRSVDTPVTSTIADSVNGYAMQIQSDGAGPYTNTKYVESTVQACCGDWELDTNYSKFSTRNVWLDFTKPVAGTGPNGGNPIAPFASGLAKVRFISKCHLYNVNMFTMPVGVTAHCPLATGFTYGGATYRLQMNPLTGVDVNPETDYVNITCTSANASAQCTSWKIEPNGSKGGCASADCSVVQNVARLSKLVSSKGQTVSVNQGDFYVAFSITVTNP